MILYINKDTETCVCPRCHGTVRASYYDSSLFECDDCDYEYPVTYDKNGVPEFIVADDNSEELYLEQLEEDSEYDEAYFKDIYEEDENRRIWEESQK